MTAIGASIPLTVDELHARTRIQDLNRRRTDAPEASGTAPTKDAKKLREAATEFESILVHQLLKVMRNSIQKSGLLGGGTGESVFQDMLDDRYALEITKSARFGLADRISEELSKRR